MKDFKMSNNGQMNPYPTIFSVQGYKFPNFERISSFFNRNFNAIVVAGRVKATITRKGTRHNNVIGG